MHVVTINASPKQLSKLRNGLAVRIRKGSGFNLLVHPETYKLVSRAFVKNKGLQIKLSPEEIEINRNTSPEEHIELKEANPEIAGQGIFGKKFDRVLKRAGIKDAVYAAGDVLKPLAKGAITAGLTAGATALGGLQPELIPFLPGGVAGLSGIASDYLDHPGKYQGHSGIKGKPSKTLTDKVTRTKMINKLNKETGTNYDYMSNAGIGKAVDDYANAGFTTDAIRARYGLPATHGQGLGSHKHREVGSVGRGGGLISHSNHIPPALVSQPHGANFQFQHTLPPQYQKYNKSGSGLYA